MRSRARVLLSCIVGLAVAVAVFAPAWPAGNGKGQDKVAPPNASVGGKTYAEWSAAWWQWALALPVSGGTHPFYASEEDFDVTLGQSGKVWFLAGVFGEAERTITIPSGTRLFLPIANTEASNVESDPFYGATADEQREAAAAFADYIVDPYLEVDGTALENVSDYRFSSPQFSFTMPEDDNILFVSASGGTSVSDGYWAMIGPLSKGQHTIRFSATFEDTPYGDLSLDTTYYVTVK
ncbi:MAG: hypothetical protein ACYC3X_31085 [Pirellulaceae bacterium]